MRGAEVLHFNQQRKDLRKVAEHQQREQDLLLLEMALEKERQAIEGTIVDASNFAATVIANSLRVGWMGFCRCRGEEEAGGLQERDV